MQSASSVGFPELPNFLRRPPPTEDERNQLIEQYKTWNSHQPVILGSVYDQRVTTAPESQRQPFWDQFASLSTDEVIKLIVTAYPRNIPSYISKQMPQEILKLCLDEISRLKQIEERQLEEERTAVVSRATIKKQIDREYQATIKTIMRMLNRGTGRTLKELCAVLGTNRKATIKRVLGHLRARKMIFFDKTKKQYFLR